MKKIFYLLLIVGLAVTSCKKPADIPSTQDVVFKATPTATGNFKDSQPGDCENPVAQYALIDIDGTVLTVDVFYLSGVIYTNTLKLAPGAHTVNSFVLMNDNGTPANTGDDFIVQATPLIGSEYENFVEMPLPFEFSVDAFYKAEINIEILCFVPNEYELFGFAWFTVEEVIVREVCFYGDFCTKYFEDYAQSLYAQQSMGLRHDMPAIFKIEVWRTHDVDGEPVTDSITTFDNEEWLGEGKALCVKYPDFKNVEDTFSFKLYILVKVGDGFEYVLFHTFTTVDAQPLAEIGTDNVLDFALGSCVEEADLILAPYLNLPETATLTTSVAYFPGPLGSSTDVTLESIPNYYNLINGTYGAYLLEYNDWLGLGWTYTDLKLYSSLYPSLINSPFVDYLDNINWLMNNLYRYPLYTGQDIQNAIWLMTGHNPTWWGTPSTTAIQMQTDAISFGDGYLPPVGGYASIVFDPNSVDDSFEWILLFIVVDP